jgi:hypothetical protein
MPTTDEGKLSMAIEAIQGPSKLSIRAASKIYGVKRTTLHDRVHGRPARRDAPANSKILTPLEEDAIVQYILELSARYFPPRLRSVEEMASQLLRARSGCSGCSGCTACTASVGQRWTQRFIKRRTELRMR